MSSYFDEADSAVNEGDLENALAVEKRVVTEVLDISGDPEFPADLRDRIVGCIAKQALADDPGWFEMMGSSQLLGSLHSVFHEVARRRITTRFGLLYDHPAYMLEARKEEK